MTPKSLIGRSLRALCCAACMVAAIGLGTPARAQDPLAPALSAADAALGALKGGVAATREALRAIERDASTVKAAESNADLEAGLASIRRHQAALDAFAAYTDKAGRATDAGTELTDLQGALRNDLARDVRAMSERLAAGAGSAFAADLDRYTKQASEVMAAAERLHGQLAEMRDQSRLASVLYGGENDPRYRRLVEQFGKEFADTAAYAPSSPREVFRPTAAPLEPTLIWDEQEEEWYRIDSKVPVETIFRESLLASGRRPTPGQLKVLADNFGKLQTHRAAADSLADYLRAAAQPGDTPPARAFAQVGEDVKTMLMPADPAMFRLKYVYDASFRTATLEALDKLRQKLGEQNAEASLRELDGLLMQHNITLESQWAQSALPAVGDVRVVAWFADNPKEKFTSTWSFDKEKVTIAISNGYAHGTRSGDVVRTEGSIPGKNCIATDERVFAKDGKLTFSAVYTCTLADGSTQINNRSGEGTWQIAAPAPPPQAKPRARR